MQIITHPTHSIRRLGMLVALNGISTGNSYASCQRNMLEIIPKENFLDTLSSVDSLERTRLRECNSDFGNSIWPAIQANRYCIAALEDWLFQRMEACAKKNTVSYTTEKLGRFTEETLHLYDSVY